MEGGGGPRDDDAFNSRRAALQENVRNAAKQVLSTTSKLGFTLQSENGQLLVIACKTSDIAAALTGGTESASIERTKEEKSLVAAVRDLLSFMRAAGGKLPHLTDAIDLYYGSRKAIAGLASPQDWQPYTGFD